MLLLPLLIAHHRLLHSNSNMGPVHTVPHLRLTLILTVKEEEEEDITVIITITITIIIVTQLVAVIINTLITTPLLRGKLIKDCKYSSQYLHECFYACKCH